MTEVIHSMLEDGPTTCERCGGSLRRILYPTGIIFKGSGFYKTDSRSGGASKPKGEAPAGAASASSDGGGSSDSSKKTDSASAPPKSATSGDAG
jgi:predicted nucleic acid-binding Zn ribbon protein